MSLTSNLMSSVSAGLVNGLFPSPPGVTIPSGARIVEVGTSLTDNGYRDHSESTTIRGYGSRGAMNWVRASTNQSFEYYNVGIGGDTIDDMLNRYMFDVLPLEPDFVFVDAGTNDSAKTFEQYKTKLAELYTALGSTGATVVPYQIPYRGSPTSDAVNDLYAQVNEWIVANYPNNIDTNKYFSDLTTKRPLGNYTVDGIHYSNVGAYAVSRAVVEAVTFTPRDIIGTALTTNPALSGSGGSQDAGVTGTMPDGYHFDILSGTPTVVVDTDQGFLRSVFTPSGTAGEETFRIHGDEFTAQTVGKLYEFIASIKLSDWDGWTYAELRMIRNDSAVAISSYDLRQEATGFAWPSEAYTDFLMSRVKDVYTTSDTGGFTPYIYMGISGDATGTGTMEVNRWQIQEFTPPVFTDVTSTVPDIEVGFRANIANIDYNAGTQIVNVYGKYATPFTFTSSSHYTNYDATAFGGRGGVAVNGEAQRLMANANIPANCLVWGVCDLGGSEGINYDTFGFGTTSTSDFGSAVNKFLQSNGQNRWYANEGGSSSQIIGTSTNSYLNTRIAFIVEFKNGVLNYWLNDGVTALATGEDIFDGYIDRGRLIMGGGKHETAELWLSHNTFDDMHVTPVQLMDDMKARWGIA